MHRSTCPMYSSQKLDRSHPYLSVVLTNRPPTKQSRSLPLTDNPGSRLLLSSRQRTNHRTNLTRPLFASHSQIDGLCTFLSLLVLSLLATHLDPDTTPNTPNPRPR
ncbi:hypothetical protein FOIG_00302 [Fusarium odoratissimum NRRL 54006]|uniref:Uncharacterized protein n=2 Tax=Fusarium oxysporum species complex TaxID=171631 RepID=X0KMR8_FUSO5|nr:uncharacterized protein FOIG_00302 [Fusarium odoratissimum NRRL 54006]EXM10057.1 hypothetical protein FOIG_00302 [Fusarium odoratissimum NRRL 54006]TXC04225.1 hypothetical protein FocTR4_00001846 [Fusarium oxysporum f. sp. cubense]